MIPALEPLAKRISRFRAVVRDTRGSFAITFSLMAPILILMIGLGVDMLTSLSFKARWDASADAAALAADQTATAYAKANAATLSASQLATNAIALGVAAGLKAFNANAAVSEVTGSVTPTVTMTNQGTQFTATAKYTGSVTTHFGGLVGVPTFAVAGQAVASAGLTTYINYYILVDNSQSMGIGATQTDMANLYNATAALGYSGDTEPGCVFGCHVTQFGRPLTNEQVAHNNGITLRIDAAKTAIQNVINQAQALSTTGNIKIGLYTMQLNPVTNSYVAATLATPSSNYSSLTSSLSSMDLGPNNAGGSGDSDMTDTLQNFAANILPSNGTGYSAASPLNYVFVVTDGVLDLTGPCNADGHCTAAMPASSCSALQQKSTVGVIYTTYLPIYQNNNSAMGYDPSYALLVQSFQSNILPSLQGCASTASLFFQANDGPALISAMQQLFASTSNTLRLTQ